jgi:hypothetical protein
MLRQTLPVAAVDAIRTINGECAVVETTILVYTISTTSILHPPVKLRK